MIWLLPAFAGGSILGQHQGHAVEARIDKDQSVDLAWNDSAVVVPAPGKGCTTRATWREPSVQLEWVCGATLKAFGDVVVQTWTPGEPSPSGALREDGVVWITAEVRERLSTGDSVGARGLVARYASRLQYAGSEAQRADLLMLFVESTVGRVDAALLENDPTTAGYHATDLLQSPPIWEPERPWDYMQKLRIGPPAGNRPAPERAGYLPATPDAVVAVTALAQALELGGETRAAIELAKNVIAVAPEHGRAHLVLADALWRQGSVEAARLEYAEAKTYGLIPERAQR